MSEIIIAEILGKLFLKEAIVSTYKYCKEFLKKKDKILEFDQTYFTESLSQNLSKTINWSNNIYFSGLISEKKTEETHVNLDFYLSPLRETHENIKPKENLLEEIFNQTSKHIIILGEGGSGKSTTMQMLSKKILSDENYLPDYTFPLVIRFREFNEDFKYLSKHSTRDQEQNFETYKGNLLFWILYRELGLHFKNKTDHDKTLNFIYDISSGFLKTFIIAVLNFLKPIIILDGFDEIDLNLRPKIFNEINELCLGMTNARVVITSRSGEFEYTISNAHKFQLAPLTANKIELFCKRWLKDANRGEELFSAIKNSPFYDTTIRPINLTLLATLFEANGYLPPKPRSVYRDIIDLQIFKWDKIRNVNRVSNVSNFDPSIKFEFLSHLAFHLSKENLIVFDKYKLEHIYKKILSSRFSLNPEQFEEVINEIETHSGIFVQSGRDRYEFPHKSIQEYFTGEYLTRYQPISDLKEVVTKLPNELAIATSLSNNPTYILKEARKLLLTNQKEMESNFLIYIKRLISEKIDFIPSKDLGLDVISLWVDLFSKTTSLKLHFYEFYTLNGISESVSLLEENYKVDASIYPQVKNMSKQKLEEIKYDFQTNIILRDKKSYGDKRVVSFSIPLFFVLNWKYMPKFS